MYSNKRPLLCKRLELECLDLARPSPPRNCTVTAGNNTNAIEDSTQEDMGDSLIVRCVAGYDGGLPQLVVLEALDSISGTIRFNVTANETGNFNNFISVMS